MEVTPSNLQGSMGCSDSDSDQSSDGRQSPTPLTPQEKKIPTLKEIAPDPKIFNQWERIPESKRSRRLRLQARKKRLALIEAAERVQKLREERALRRKQLTERHDVQKQERQASYNARRVSPCKPPDQAQGTSKGSGDASSGNATTEGASSLPDKVQDVKRQQNQDSSAPRPSEEPGGCSRARPTGGSGSQRAGVALCSRTVGPLEALRDAIRAQTLTHGSDTSLSDVGYASSDSEFQPKRHVARDSVASTVAESIRELLNMRHLSSPLSRMWQEEKKVESSPKTYALHVYAKATASSRIRAALNATNPESSSHANPQAGHRRNAMSASQSTQGLGTCSVWSSASKELQRAVHSNVQTRSSSCGRPELPPLPDLTAQARGERSRGAARQDLPMMSQLMFLSHRNQGLHTDAVDLKREGLSLRQHSNRSSQLVKLGPALPNGAEACEKETQCTNERNACEKTERWIRLQDRQGARNTTAALVQGVRSGERNKSDEDKPGFRVAHAGSIPSTKFASRIQPTRELSPRKNYGARRSNIARQSPRGAYQDRHAGSHPCGGKPDDRTKASSSGQPFPNPCKRGANPEKSTAISRKKSNHRRVQRCRKSAQVTRTPYQGLGNVEVRGLPIMTKEARCCNPVDNGPSSATGPTHRSVPCGAMPPSTKPAEQEAKELTAADLPVKEQNAGRGRESPLGEDSSDRPRCLFISSYAAEFPSDDDSEVIDSVGMSDPGEASPGQRESNPHAHEVLSAHGTSSPADAETSEGSDSRSACRMRSPSLGRGVGRFPNEQLGSPPPSVPPRSLRSHSLSVTLMGGCRPNAFLARGALRSWSDVRCSQSHEVNLPGYVPEETSKRGDADSLGQRWETEPESWLEKMATDQAQGTTRLRDSTTETSSTFGSIAEGIFSGKSPSPALRNKRDSTSLSFKPTDPLEQAALSLLSSIVTREDTVIGQHADIREDVDVHKSHGDNRSVGTQGCKSNAESLSIRSGPAHCPEEDHQIDSNESNRTFADRLSLTETHPRPDPALDAPNTPEGSQKSRPGSMETSHGTEAVASALFLPKITLTLQVNSLRCRTAGGKLPKVDCERDRKRPVNASIRADRSENGHLVRSMGKIGQTWRMSQAKVPQLHLDDCWSVTSLSQSDKDAGQQRRFRSLPRVEAIYVNSRSQTLPVPRDVQGQQPATATQGRRAGTPAELNFNSSSHSEAEKSLSLAPECRCIAQRTKIERLPASLTSSTRVGRNDPGVSEPGLVIGRSALMSSSRTRGSARSLDLRLPAGKDSRTRGPPTPARRLGARSGQARRPEMLSMRIINAIRKEGPAKSPSSENAQTGPGATSSMKERRERDGTAKGRLGRPGEGVLRILPTLSFATSQTQPVKTETKACQASVTNSSKQTSVEEETALDALHYCKSTQTSQQEAQQSLRSLFPVHIHGADEPMPRDTKPTRAQIRSYEGKTPERFPNRFSRLSAKLESTGRLGRSGVLMTKGTAVLVPGANPPTKTSPQNSASFSSRKKFLPGRELPRRSESFRSTSVPRGSASDVSQAGPSHAGPSHAGPVHAGPGQAEERSQEHRRLHRRELLREAMNPKTAVSAFLPPSPCSETEPHENAGWRVNETGCWLRVPCGRATSSMTESTSSTPAPSKIDSSLDRKPSTRRDARRRARSPGSHSHTPRRRRRKLVRNDDKERLKQMADANRLAAPNPHKVSRRKHESGRTSSKKGSKTKEKSSVKRRKKSGLHCSDSLGSTVDEREGSVKNEFSACENILTNILEKQHSGYCSRDNLGLLNFESDYSSTSEVEEKPSGCRKVRRRRRRTRKKRKKSRRHVDPESQATSHVAPASPAPDSTGNEPIQSQSDSKSSRRAKGTPSRVSRSETDSKTLAPRHSSRKMSLRKS